MSIVSVSHTALLFSAPSGLSYFVALQKKCTEVRISYETRLPESVILTLIEIFPINFCDLWEQICNKSFSQSDSEVLNISISTTLSDF